MPSLIRIISVILCLIPTYAFAQDVNTQTSDRAVYSINAPLDEISALNKTHTEKLDADNQELFSLLEERDLRNKATTREIFEQADLVTIVKDLKTTLANISEIGSNDNNIAERLNKIDESLSKLNASEQILQNPANQNVAREDIQEKLAEINQQRFTLNNEKQILNDLRSVLNQRNTINNQIKSIKEARLNEVEGYLFANRNITDELSKATAMQNDPAINATQKTLEDLQSQYLNPDISEEKKHNISTQINMLELESRIGNIQQKQAIILSFLGELNLTLARSGQSIDIINKSLNNLHISNESLNALKITATTIENDLKFFETNFSNIEDKITNQALVDEIKSKLTDLNLQLVQFQTNNKDGLDRVGSLTKRLEQLSRELINAQLLKFTHFPDSSIKWGEIAHGFLNLPALLSSQVKISLFALWDNFVKSSNGIKFLFFLAEATIFAVGFSLYLFLNNLFKSNAHTGRLQPYTSTQNLLTLIKRNLLELILLIAAALPLFFFKISNPGLSILWAIIATAGMLKFSLSTCYLVLMRSQEKYPWLFRCLALPLILSILMMFSIYVSRLLNVDSSQISMLERILMTWILFLQWPLNKMNQIISKRSKQKEEATSARYFFIKIADLIFRGTILIASLVSIIGFIDLGRFILFYAIILIILLVLWRLLKGLLKDAVKLFKNYAMIYSSRGLFLAQDVIEPLHHLLRYFLFGLIWIVIPLYISSLQEIPLLSWTLSMLGTPLFNIGDAPINLMYILSFILSTFLVFSFGKWLKRIVYRWILGSISDLGIRNSISVFTQYVTVIIGFFIILNVLGIDLTTLTIFAGALGVGLGFGLQTIFNNLVSGILLLIERPLCSGDIVEIDGTTGTIDRIGIRSLTMRTFDNMDVIIPNSSVITNSFVNWTHQTVDVRTIVYVSVIYDDNPSDVVKVLQEILDNDPEVLKDPEPFAFVDEFAESAIRYRVSFFTDLNVSNMLEVKSKILQKIYHELKKHGYTVALPRRIVDIRNALEPSFPEQKETINVTSDRNLDAAIPETVETNKHI